LVEDHPVLPDQQDFPTSEVHCIQDGEGNYQAVDHKDELEDQDIPEEGAPVADTRAEQTFSLL